MNKNQTLGVTDDKIANLDVNIQVFKTNYPLMKCLYATLVEEKMLRKEGKTMYMKSYEVEVGGLDQPFH